MLTSLSSFCCFRTVFDVFAYCAVNFPIVSKTVENNVLDPSHSPLLPLFLTWKTVALVAGLVRLSAGSAVHAGWWRTRDVHLLTFGAREPGSAVATVRARDVHTHAAVTAQPRLLCTLVHIVQTAGPVVARRTPAGDGSFRKGHAGSPVGAWRGDAAVHLFTIHTWERHKTHTDAQRHTCTIKKN